MRQYTPPSLDRTSTPAVEEEDVLWGKSVHDLMLAKKFMTKEEWDYFEEILGPLVEEKNTL